MHNEKVTKLSLLYRGAGQFFSCGYISLSNILTDTQSIGDAGRRGFVMRVPLAVQRNCVWLLLADQNTIKKTAFPWSRWHYTSCIASVSFSGFLRTQMHGKWEYFRKSDSKTGPEKSVIVTGVRTTEVNTCWTMKKMGMLEKWSEMDWYNGEKEARKGGLGLGHHIFYS